MQSNSDTDSDFLRVEFKRIALPDLPEAGKHVAAPATPTPGTQTDFENASLRIDRITCPPGKPCSPAPEDQRSLLIAVKPAEVESGHTTSTLSSGEVIWLPADKTATPQLSPDAQFLRVTFLVPPQ